jgi:hypothetical protein
MNEYLNSGWVKNFLNLPLDGKSSITVKPQELNPLIRCLEIMGEPCIIEMKIPAEIAIESSCKVETYPLQEIRYKVYRKFQISSKSTVNPYKEIPGVGMVENKLHNIL